MLNRKKKNVINFNFVDDTLRFSCTPYITPYTLFLVFE
jgi:hypothetical protein